MSTIGYFRNSATTLAGTSFGRYNCFGRYKGIEFASMAKKYMFFVITNNGDYDVVAVPSALFSTLRDPHPFTKEKYVCE